MRGTRVKKLRKAFRLLGAGQEAPLQKRHWRKFKRGMRGCSI